MKTLSVGDIVDENDTMRTSIVTIGKCSETFLPCGIEEVEAVSLAMDRELLHFEIYAYCGGR
jgi:hypothetical protein